MDIPASTLDLVEGDHQARLGAVRSRLQAAEDTLDWTNQALAEAIPILSDGANTGAVSKLESQRVLALAVSALQINHALPVAGEMSKLDAVKFLKAHADWLATNWSLSPEGRSYQERFLAAVAALGR